ncbi:cytochrome P450 [Nocardia sp. GAS34]|uniref:cytochrome P450 n=1 Tax=unclassified Nocardia TaxID=2637762 RepID=UPI003D22B899
MTTPTDEHSGAAAYLRLIDPAVRADPYPVYARIRDGGPFRVAGAPIVVLSGYADCAAMLRHPAAGVDRTLSTARLATMPVYRAGSDDRTDEAVPSFLFLDPPDHTRLRRLVSKAFTPRVVARLEPRITEIVDTLLDSALTAGGFDAVADLAYPLPVTVICELLGVPLADEQRLGHWSRIVSRCLDPTSRSLPQFRADPDELRRAADDMYAYFEELIDVRRAHPGPDLLSELIAAEEAGDTLTHGELISTCALLLTAGHETTVNLIANAVLALLRDPRHLAALRADPGSAAGIVEETLRYDPPVQLIPRIAADDLDIGGTRIDHGDIVIMLIAAAHRDPVVFSDPDRFDPTRENRHLAFGLGAHFCLGAPLARREAIVALTRFAQRVESPRLHSDPPPYRPHINLRGPEAIQITL